MDICIFFGGGSLILDQQLAVQLDREAFSVTYRRIVNLEVIALPLFILWISGGQKVKSALIQFRLLLPNHEASLRKLIETSFALPPSDLQQK